MQQMLFKPSSYPSIVRVSLDGLRGNSTAVTSNQDGPQYTMASTNDGSQNGGQRIVSYHKALSYVPDPNKTWFRQHH